ncbi:MAG: FkbM family methyltransferase [Planctomycetales bacterium]|nr:FkbM family methyltransferase [Planctomycetales bacterium]
MFRNFGADLEIEAEAFPGITMRLGYRDRIQKTIIATGKWDPHTADTLRTLLSSGDTFVDVGANVGYFSLLASQLVGPTGRVFAFEPSLRALARLTDHLERNRIRNVLVAACGLADRRALLTLHRADDGNIGKSSLGLDTSETCESETIQTVRLDDYIAEFEVVPRVIKIDVEGAELLALRGMENTLRNGSPFVLCEVIETYLARLDCSAAELFEFMRDLGYQCFAAVDENGQAKWQPIDAADERGSDADLLFAKQDVPASLLHLSSARTASTT